MLFKKPAQRKVFGFPCSPQLKKLMKDLSALLSCPIFVISEHCLGVGAMTVVSALKDSEYKEMLISHLQSEHLLKRTIVLNDEYDIAAAQQALKQELARVRLDKVAHELVAMWKRKVSRPGCYWISPKG